MLRRVATGLGFLLAGCTASASEVRPPTDALFFPTGLAISPDQQHLFALSANSQLEYDSGTVSVIDVADVAGVVAPWLADGTVPSTTCGDGTTPCCQREVASPEILDCEASTFIQANAGVRIGNFAANLAIQDKGGGNLRLVIPVRGDPSVTWVDWSAADRTLSCGDASGFALCDEDHRLTRFRGDSSLPQLGDEPFGVYVDSVGEYAVVTHLTAGAATLVDLPVEPDAARPIMLADQKRGLFGADTVGNVGAIGVAGRAPGSPDDLLYVTSTSENRVQTFSVARPDVGPPLLAAASYFFLDRVGANGQGSSSARAIAFGAGGDQAYVLNRLPPSVALVDTSLDPQGIPRNDVRAGVDICREAVGLTVADVGDGERAYVTCFQDGQLYVVDPRGGLEVEEVSTIGHGPFGIAAAPDHDLLFIADFFDNSIAVVDLTPGSPTRYRVVLRVGIPATE